MIDGPDDGTGQDCSVARNEWDGTWGRDPGLGRAHLVAPLAQVEGGRSAGSESARAGLHRVDPVAPGDGARDQAEWGRPEAGEWRTSEQWGSASWDGPGKTLGQRGCTYRRVRVRSEERRVGKECRS